MNENKENIEYPELDDEQVKAFEEFAESEASLQPFNQVVEKEHETIKVRQSVTPEMLATRTIRKMFGIRLHPYVRPYAKIGRNDKCPCGSDKKYKKCCGMN